MKFFLIFLIGILFNVSEAAKTPTSKGPQKVVQEIFEKAGKKQVITSLGLQKEINENVDFKKMAQSVLGKEHDKQSSAEREWFEQTLKEIITRTIYPEAPKFLNKVKIKYKRVKQRGKSARVSSIVRNRGETTEVDYDLQLEDGVWKVVDIAIDGESWVDSISEQVHRTLQKRKWNGLRERLSKKLDSLRSEKLATREDI